jgi:hypothetical protein
VYFSKHLQAPHVRKYSAVNYPTSKPLQDVSKKMLSVSKDQVIITFCVFLGQDVKIK